ncbi:fluoride efflux transporter CrcB [Luteimonas terricola]|uniref:Fluoride-specific ion channel FluC n=1 Tax=Luteimonas terricola TaxID=645597 RepID=A0ABQ2EMH4_9GAMM|nr:fluoride efflux transporter CrcB [Luteimonas terricola]GGK16923.1 putative fluoride ion transporter CrcB [Luteimonas terricola]
MSAYLWVGLGGFLGSVARYAAAVALGAAPTDRFPWATFAVNCLGCLLIGVLVGASAKASVSEPVRLFLVTGILGGFTTFSAFGLEALTLLRRGETSLALLYILGSVLVGIAAVWLGLRFTSGAEA